MGGLGSGPLDSPEMVGKGLGKGRWHWDALCLGQQRPLLLPASCPAPAPQLCTLWLEPCGFPPQPQGCAHVSSPPGSHGSLQGSQGLLRGLASLPHAGEACRGDYKLPREPGLSLGADVHVLARQLAPPAFPRRTPQGWPSPLCGPRCGRGQPLRAERGPRAPSWGGSPLSLRVDVPGRLSHFNHPPPTF